MKEQIKAVQQYFKDKILAKDFVIKSIGEHTLKLVIDEQFTFYIWIANYSTIPEGVKIYDCKISFMDIEFTANESIQLCNLLKRDIETSAYRIKIDAIEKKRKELEELEKSIL